LIEIPHKNNISFIQKQHCIEAIPSAVFQIILEYSKELDYRNLMNSNLATFQSIKSETVKYSLIGPTNWFDNFPSRISYKEASLLKIIKNVKDKSKQISMSFVAVKQPILLKYNALFQEIHRFELHCSSPLQGSFPLKMFNHIYHLILDNVHGISVLKSGFQNVVKLELIWRGFILFEEANPTGSLKEFAVRPSKDIKITIFE
jgi:hypothetical protein